MKFILAALLWLVAIGGDALANMVQRPPSAAGYTGPGDIVSGAVVWGSCTFAYNAAYATGSNAGCNYIRASDGNTCDTLITTAGVQGNTANCSSGLDNGLALSTWLLATTGKVITVYDQSGALNCTGSTACSPTMATDSKRPSVSLSCINSLMCFTFTSAAVKALVTAGSMAAQAQPVTCYVVTTRTSASSVRALAQGTAGTNATIGWTASADTAFISGGTTLSATATDNAPHVILGVYNGASSVIAIDNSETTGAGGSGGISAGTLTIGATQGGGSGNMNGAIGEFGCWHGAVSAGDRTALAANAKTTRWGF